MKTINGQNNVKYEIEEMCDLRIDTLEELIEGFSDTDVNLTKLREHYQDYVDIPSNNVRKLIKVTRKTDPSDITYPQILKNIYNNIYRSSVVKSICSVLMLYDNEQVAQYISNTKGTRVENMQNTMIKWLNSFSSFSSSESDKAINIVNNLLDTEKTFYYLIDNTWSGILGASYSQNYGSCYNCEEGEYRASLDYILSDNLESEERKWFNVYHIKESYVVDIINNKYINLDDLYEAKLGRNTIVTNFDTKYSLGNTYGFNEISNFQDFVKIVATALDNNIDLEQYDFCRDSCVYYELSTGAYKDLECNNWSLVHKTKNDNLRCLWEYDTIKLFEHGYVCPICGCEHSDEDDLIYLCNGDMACRECAFCCEDCGEWFLYSDDHYRVHGALYCENCVEFERE